MEALEDLIVQRSVVALPSPAVGQGLTDPVSGAVRWRLFTLSFRLATSAGVANRSAIVRYLDANGVPFVTLSAPFIQAASLTTDYTFGIGLQQFGASGAVAIGGPLPDVTLDRTTSIQVAIGAVQANDQVSRVRLFVEQHNERP